MRTSAAVLTLALEAADGKDVRIGGGANTVRQVLGADLIDTLHVAVGPRGARRRVPVVGLSRRAPRPVSP